MLQRNLELPEGACVVEVGPGYGAFIEVLRKVRPDLRIALVDIAPQPYIAEQRCKAIFGDASQGSGSVVGFRTTTNMKTIDLATFKAGTISIQEMTRAQAARYIATLGNADKEYFYFDQL
jgi:putative sugar O-methyltransferase